MAVEKILIRHKPFEDDNGQYNYDEGVLTGVINQTDSTSDLYSTVFNSEINQEMLTDSYLPSYGVGINFFLNIQYAVSDPSGCDFEFESMKVKMWMVDDDINVDGVSLRNGSGGIKDGITSSVIENPYVNGGTSSTDRSVILNTAQEGCGGDDCRIFDISYSSGDDEYWQACPESGCNGTTFVTYDYMDESDEIFIENFPKFFQHNDISINPTTNVGISGTPQPFRDISSYFNTDTVDWNKALYDDSYEDNFYFIVYTQGYTKCWYFSAGWQYDSEARPYTLTVFKIPKQYLSPLFDPDNSTNEIFFDFGGSAASGEGDYNYSVPSPLTEYTPAGDQGSRAHKIGHFHVKFTGKSEYNTSQIQDDFSLPLYTDDYFLLNINKIVDYNNLTNNDIFIDNDDIIDFRPISTVTVQGGDFDIQSYYEEASESERIQTSAPNTVNLSLQMAENDTTFNVDYLTENDVGDFGFMGFVVNWNWQEGDPDTLDGISYNFPQSIADMNLQQSTNDLYYYVGGEITDDRMTISSSDLSHTYQTAGIKTIQAVVFSYLENPNGDGSIQAIRWKLVKIRVHLGLDSAYIEDFSDIGGFEFTYIPWPYTTGIVGGLSDKSKYVKSLNEIVKKENFAEYEYLDKSLTSEAFNNTELGDYFGKSDVSQIRLFSTGSYDLNSLLGISELAYINPSGDGTPEDYKSPRDDTYWDGIINKFPEESCVGKIFIDDEMDLNLRNNCVLELNCGDVDGDTIRDSSGNGNKGILIGDFEVSKDSKDIPLNRKSNLKVPSTGTDDLAF